MKIFYKKWFFNNLYNWQIKEPCKTLQQSTEKRCENLYTEKTVGK